MADKDKGSDKSRRKGGEDPKKISKTTSPAAPKTSTKPATKVNDPSAKGPPRGQGGR